MSSTVAVKNTNEDSNTLSMEELIKENQVLKILNEKLYKRTLNQRRKILRLKHQSNLNDSTDETEPKESTLNDNVWEDIEEVMASYNIEKTI
jgi:hypothetical protein